MKPREYRQASFSPVIWSLFRRDRLCLLGLIGSLISAIAGTGKTHAVDRDWERFPAVFELQTQSDVIAVGDVHGDYDRLVDLLATNRLIAGRPARAEEAQWVAGRVILICTGDMIDRWTNGLSVIRFFRSLQTKARAAGGDVVVTMGNHEAEFLSVGGDHHRTQGLESELRQAQFDPELVRAGKDPEGLGQFLRSLPFAAVVNDWFFVHAGNCHGASLAQLKNDLQNAVSREGFGTPLLSDPDSMLEARLQPKP